MGAEEQGLDLRLVEDTLRDARDAAARVTRPLFRQNATVDNKATSGFDPVTEADREAEKAIREVIGANFPDHGIIGEEWDDAPSDSPYAWVIDPIDGTRAFITGIPLWGTLIGLTRNGAAIAGLMAQPFTGETYFGLDGRAWLDGPDGRQDLAVSGQTDLTRARLATTDPAMFRAPGSRAAYDAIHEKALMARYGTDCYAYCLLAAGHVDLVIEEGLKPVDIAALVPIIEGAGGTICSWSGGRVEQGGQVVAAASTALCDAARDLLAPAARD